MSIPILGFGTKSKRHLFRLRAKNWFFQTHHGWFPWWSHHIESFQTKGCANAHCPNPGHWGWKTWVILHSPPPNRSWVAKKRLRAGSPQAKQTGISIPRNKPEEKPLLRSKTISLPRSKSILPHAMIRERRASPAPYGKSMPFRGKPWQKRIQTTDCTTICHLPGWEMPPPNLRIDHFSAFFSWWSFGVNHKRPLPCSMHSFDSKNPHHPYPA